MSTGNSNILSHGIVCQQTSRFDMDWALYDTQATPTLLSRLAVLEIKNTNVIHKEDFKPAAANKGNFHRKWQGPAIKTT
ncbi:hypothetical protein BJX76DRAFT_333601 [Aspergillus varians]